MSGFFHSNRSDVQSRGGIASRPQSAEARRTYLDRPMTASARRNYTPYHHESFVGDEDVRKVAHNEHEYRHPDGPKYLHQGTEVFNIKTDVDKQRTLKLGPADPVPHTVTRRHTRQVEVPYEKEVKVPVKVPKVVPGKKAYRQVKVKRLVEQPSFEMVDEVYTEVEEVPAVRHKTVWVEKIVPERYMKQVEVTKTRKVKVPTTVLQEIEDFETVSVIDDAATEVDAFRIDRVGGKKLVEVEEEQEYEAFYRPKGAPRAVNEHELGILHGVRTSRHVGKDYFEDDVYSVDNDSEPNDGAYRHVRPGTGMRARPSSAMSNRSISHYKPATPMFEQTGMPTQLQQNGFRLGVNLKPTDYGVVVDQVFRGEPAERAGLRVGDIITGVSGYQTGDMKEFRNALYMSPGNVELEVRNARGRRKVAVAR